MLKICLLGSFDVRYDQNLIKISGRSAQSLFAYLVLNNGISHQREKLARLLWPDSPEKKAREHLRHTLWRIRKALPSNPSIEYFLTDDFTISFNSSCEHRFDVTELKRADEHSCADKLISALSVYRGELLPGFYDEWVTLERGYLNYVFEHNMARLLVALQSESRWLEILEWGERWITFGQRPEPAYRALMCAHMQKGDIPKVADTYERCISSLSEIGLEPTEQTQVLFENLKAGRVPQYH